MSSVSSSLSSTARFDGLDTEKIPLPEQAAADARMLALYRFHAEPLFRFLLRLTMGKRHAAEDLLQETMLRAWRNIDVLPADVESWGPWLFTVARRIAIDAARARQARPPEIGMADVSRFPVMADVYDRVVSVQLIRDALPKLSVEHRTVLIELYYRGRSTVEAAQSLGIPAGTVKSRAYYALRSLGAAIGITEVG